MKKSERKKYCFLSMSFILGSLLTFFPVRSYAQSCSNTERYNAQVKPEADKRNILEEYTYDVQYYSDGNLLHIIAFDDGSAAFYRVVEEFAKDNARYITFEFRAWISQSQQPSWLPAVNIGVLVSDENRIAMIWPGPDPTEGRIYFSYSNLDFRTSMKDHMEDIW